MIFMCMSLRIRIMDKVFQFYFFKLKIKYIKKELKEEPTIFYLKLIHNKYKNYTIYLL
jgi:hypothetical protein